MGRKRHRGRAALPAITTLLLASPALAQDEGTADPLPVTTESTIFVTGTRIARPNAQSASPIQSVNAEEFVLTGVPNVEQTLNQLPQLVPGFTNTSNNPGTGAATLNLRGLGSVRTLILVNGRRWIASDAGQVPEVDVNTIPAALIERVDIVTGGASAVYGSDAVTGVINIILRDEIEGLHLEVRQNITEQGDGRVSSADLSFGTRALGDRLRLLASVGFLDQAAVRQSERVYTRVALLEGCAVPGTRNETGASQVVNDPQCAPPNEIALTAGGSAAVPSGLVQGGAFFPVPGSDVLLRNQGLTFDPDGSPRRFTPATDLFNYAPDNYLQVGLRRWSGNFIASFDISPAVEPFVELSYIETRSPRQIAATPTFIGGVQVNLDNPFLTPEGAEVLELSHGVDAEGDRGFVGNFIDGFRRNPAFDGDADGIIFFPGLASRLGLGARRSLEQRDAFRALAGLRGQISNDWRYNLYASHSRVDHVTLYRNSGSERRFRQSLLAIRDPATSQIVCIDPSGGCVPANIFGVGNLSAEAADFIRTNPQDLTLIEEQVAEASLTGSIPFLEAGPLGLVLGITGRRSAYDYNPDPSLADGDDLGFVPGTPAGGSTKVWELFAESRVPLLADRPFAHELSFELGLRMSHYESVGTVWTWKALGEWAPVAGLRLRGGFQRAVRGPNIRELFEAPVESLAAFPDPCSVDAGQLGNPEIVAACIRDGVPPSVIGDFIGAASFALTRGNPDLKAEVANTLTVGTVVAPRSIPGLSVAVDYYDIEIRRAIGVFGGGGPSVIFGCISGGADPANPLCQAYDRGPDGAVQTVDLPTDNLGYFRARGIDWQLSYRRGLGLVAEDSVDLLLAGTHVIENRFRANDFVPVYACEGTFGAPCGTSITGTATPRWKLFNNLSYRVEPVTFQLRHRFFSSTVDARIRASTALGLEIDRLSEEGRRLESRHYFDVAVSVRAGRDFDIALGVNNLTNRKPAITGANQIQANTDPSLYDMLGRRFFLALSARIR